MRFISSRRDTPSGKRVSKLALAASYSAAISMHTGNPVKESFVHIAAAEQEGRDAEEAARVEAEGQAAEAEAQRQAAAEKRADQQKAASSAGDCYYVSGNSSVQLSCSDPLCAEIGCERLDGSITRPDRQVGRDDDYGFDYGDNYANNSENGGDYTCDMYCNSMSCMQWQDYSC